MNESKTNELARTEAQTPALLKPIVSVAELIDAQKALVEFVQSALEAGKDFGVIPGTGEKAVLLKAGAERLCAGFGLTPRYDIIEVEIDHNHANTFTLTKWVTRADPGRAEKDRIKATGMGRNKKQGEKWIWQEAEKETGFSAGLYRYVLKCRLERGGVTVGEGVGSCSSLESKYVRQPQDCENTVLKMAKKRAYVDAVLTTLALSDRFTQDIEDMEENRRGRSSQPDSHSEQGHVDAEFREDEPAPVKIENPRGASFAILAELGLPPYEGKKEVFRDVFGKVLSKKLDTLSTLPDDDWQLLARWLQRVKDGAAKLPKALQILVATDAPQTEELPQSQEAA